MRLPALLLFLSSAWLWAAGPSSGGQATPREQPGAEISLYAPGQHDLYDGHFVLSATRIHQVGRLDHNQIYMLLRCQQL